MTFLGFVPSLYAQAPALAAEAPVVHGATFQEGFAPGGWVTIRGTNLSPATRIWAGADFDGNKLPERLEGVSVKINGKAAYIYFVSPTQLNVLAPDDDGAGLVDVEVTTPGGTAQTRAMLKQAAPGFFAFDPFNKRYAAVVHLDGTLAGPANLYGGQVTVRPLARGGRALAFGTGFGNTAPMLPAALIVPAPAPLGQMPTLTLGGRPLTTEFAGRSGSGLDQFNIVVAADATAGDQLLAAQSGTSRSQDNLYVCIGTDAPASLGIARDTVSLSVAANGAAPSETVGVTSSGEALGWIAAVDTAPRPAWLTVTPNGNTGSSLTITANPAGLAPGAYSATISVSSCAASNDPRRITVNFTVTGGTPAPTLSVAPMTLTFTATAGTNPAAQSLNVTSSGAALAFTATASANTGGNWLTVSPASGNTPATLSVAANVTGLAAGTYEGSVRVTAAGGAPLAVAVRLTVNAAGGGTTVTRVPKITSINPRFVPAGSVFSLEITGENLDDAYRLNIFNNVQTDWATLRATATRVTVNVAVGAAARPGSRNVSISTPQGDSNAVPLVIGTTAGAQPAGSPAEISNVAVTSTANANMATISLRLNFTDADGDIRFSESDGLISAILVTPLTPNNPGCADVFLGDSLERPNLKSGQIIFSDTYSFVTELRNVNLAVYLIDSKFNVSNVAMVNVPFYHTDCNLKPLANRAPTISNIQASSVAQANQATQQGSFDFTDPNGDIRNSGFTQLWILPRVAGNVRNCFDVLRGSFLDRPEQTTGRINFSFTFNYVTELRGGVPLELVLFDAEGNPSPVGTVTAPSWHTLCDIAGGFKPAGEKGPKVVDAQPAVQSLWMEDLAGTSERHPRWVALP
ncbi:MAG: hypothetical protein R2729_14505 [Bryobacteraceae bacterium]